MDALPFEPVELHAIDAARNIRRRWSVIARNDLFGHVMVETSWAGSASADAFWCAASRKMPKPVATSEHCWHAAHRPASVSASRIDPMVFSDRLTGVDRVEANSASLGSLPYTDGLILPNPKKKYLLAIRGFNKG